MSQFSDQRLQEFYRVAIATAAQYGGETATAEFHDFESVPLLAGTVGDISVIELEPLEGVKPVDADGKPVKNGMCGMYRVTVMTPEDVPVSFLLDNGSIRAEFKALSDGKWEHPTLAYTPEALRAQGEPPFVGMSIFVALRGHWKGKDDEGPAKNKRMGVTRFPTREKMLDAWNAFRVAIRAYGKGAGQSTGALPSPQDA